MNFLRDIYYPLVGYDEKKPKFEIIEFHQMTDTMWTVTIQEPKQGATDDNNE